MSEKECLIQEYSELNMEAWIAPQNKQLANVRPKQAYLSPEQSQQNAGRNKVEDEKAVFAVKIRNRIGNEATTPFTPTFIVPTMGYTRYLRMTRVILTVICQLFCSGNVICTLCAQPVGAHSHRAIHNKKQQGNCCHCFFAGCIKR